MLPRQALLRAARPVAPRRALAAQARAFASPASNQDPKPPMTLFGLDGTYATALYTAAAKTSTLEPTAKALTALGSLLSKDKKLEQVLGRPTLSPSDKSAIVGELMKSSGASDATVRNFLGALADNNRLALLGDVCARFEQLMSASRGEVEMTVTSAQPLDARTLVRLETAVAKSSYVGPGKKLKVTNTVDPDIVGGLIVEIGDRNIDLSVSSKMAKMNKLLTDSL